jgi:hypothetical protein
MFGKYWGNRRVVFIIYKFGSVWKIEKKVQFNELGPAQWNSDPGRLGIDCTACESDWDRGVSLRHIPTGPANHRPVVVDLWDRDHSLSLSSHYKEENAGRSFLFPVAFSPTLRWYCHPLAAS